MGTAVVVVVWTLGAAMSSFAQTSPLSAEAIQRLRATKAPEDWTTEERLAVRFDPGDIQRRHDADREEHLKNHPLDSAPSAPLDTDDTISIVGRRNPELFLPIEIFDWLIVMAFSPVLEIQESYREAHEAGLRSVDLQGKTFWPALDSIAAELIQARRLLYDLNLKLQSATPTERKEIGKRFPQIVSSMCGPRAAALAKARDQFGAKRLDRFLYQSVANNMFELSGPDSDWPQRLRAVEGGCHEPE